MKPDRVAFRLAARLMSRLSRGRDTAVDGLVLVYHGLVERPGDARPLLHEIPLSAFRAQLAYLRRHFEVVRLSELATTRERGGRFRVALTFDDDLQSHISLAAPVLDHAGLPATFFLTGGALDGPFRRWWHDLADAESEDRWSSTVAAVATDWPWAAGCTRPRELAKTIEALAPGDRDRIELRLRELGRATGGDLGVDRRGVAALRGAGFEVGFHTREHHPLTALDDDQLHVAMRAGRDELESAAGSPLQAIAYPHGAGDLRVAAAARTAGFKLGYVTGGRPIRRDDQPLLLDRIDPAPFGDGVGRFAFALSRTLAAGPDRW